MSDRCQFTTTKPLGAMKQAARRGSRIRYKRCSRRATTTVTIADPTLLSPDREREVACCTLHARLYQQKGYLP